MPDRELLITHPIGAAGRFRLAGTRGSVRIDGTDGEVAEVLARYRAPGDRDMSADPEGDGVVDVLRADGELQVAVRDPGGSGVIAGLTRLVGQVRPEVDFEVRLPRGTTVRLDGFAIDVALRGLRGDQDLRTVSGDMELHGAGGRIRVTTVSGDVSIRGDVLWLTAATTSGAISVEAELVQQLAARSVSGDVSVRAALGRDVGHTFESVSGDLQLATPSGLAIAATGVSGTVRSELPSRREQREGRRTTIVGDGGVSLRVRTVSGDVSVVGPAGNPDRGRHGDPFGIASDIHGFMAGFGAGFGAGFPGRPADLPDPVRPPAPPTPPRPPGARMPPSVAVADALPSPAASVAPTTATTAASPGGTAADQLSILRLLESGQIDVDEAARRLEALS